MKCLSFPELDTEEINDVCNAHMKTRYCDNIRGIKQFRLGIEIAEDLSRVPKSFAVKLYKEKVKLGNEFIVIWGASLEPITGNCGAKATSNSYLSIPELEPLAGKFLLSAFEAYAKATGASILVGSDRIYVEGSDGRSYAFIKACGDNWTFTKPTHNRNYPKTPDREICFYWKNIGEYDYSYFDKQFQVKR